MLTARRALVYDVAARRPRFLLLPVRDVWDPACGCPVHTEDLDTDDWFPDEPVVLQVNAFPGTTCRLGNGYDIICNADYNDEDPTQYPNQSLRRMFSVNWPGNLIVVKRSRRGCRGAMHITGPEVSLINTLVERYVFAAVAVK